MLDADGAFNLTKYERKKRT